MIGERVGLGNLFNAIYQSGGLSLSMLSTAQKIIEKTAISEGERKAVDWKIDTVTNSITWNPKKDKGVEVELNEDQVKLIEEAIVAKNKEKQFTISDGHIVTLIEKLGIKLDDSSN